MRTELDMLESEAIQLEDACVAWKVMSCGACILFITVLLLWGFYDSLLTCLVLVSFIVFAGMAWSRADARLQLVRTDINWIKIRDRIQAS